jgi:pimeloyl-ACP methyl ester carboxylesterase
VLRVMLAAMSVEHRHVDADGVRLHVAEAGGGPPVILAHGFPELWYSWRHQLPAIADAGYRAVALDMRGFGDSSAPAEVGAYDAESISGDLLAVLDDLGEERAVFVGHDWGAAVVWHLARAHPDRVAAVAGMSVPFIPPARAAPLETMRSMLGEDFYVLWFQRPDTGQALSRDVRRTLLTRRVWNARWADEQEQVERPRWMTEDDERVYVEAFERTGFDGGLNYYRNIDRNWELAKALGDRRIEPPALFLTGERDPVRQWAPAERMEEWTSDLRESIVVPGAGHWVQQEAPDAVNEALLRFLGSLAR